MDDTDRAILRHLQDDGRLSNVELAQRVGLSPSPCLRRVRALEESGAIRGYHADIDPAALDRGFEVVVHTELMLKDRATVEAFEERIAQMDDVVECRRMFGVPDYVIRVAVADATAYEAFYMTQPGELPGLALAQQLYLAVKAQGFGRNGTHALLLALSRMSGIDWRERS